MIVGIVQAREPLIRLTIRGFRGRQQEIEAVVDTGYTGGR
jgi:predicted aspartyl protease